MSVESLESLRDIRLRSVDELEGRPGSPLLSLPKTLQTLTFFLKQLRRCFGTTGSHPASVAVWSRCDTAGAYAPGESDQPRITGVAGCKLPIKFTRTWVMMNGQGVSLTAAQGAR